MRVLREHPDQVVRSIWLGMFPFALAGVVLGSGPLIAASGVAIIAVGLLLVTDFNGVLERLSARYRDSWSFRLQGKHRMTRFEGALTLVIGLFWVAIGLAVSFT